jgi:hypothetical protein
MKLIGLLPFLLSIPIGSSQSTGPAKTFGHCTIANTGNHNTFNLKCAGISKEQGDSLIRIMNEILARQLDEAAALDSLQRSAEANANSGFLIPGNEQAPPNQCDHVREVSPDSKDFWRAMPGGGKRVFLYFGNSGSIATEFPHTVIGVGDKSFLSLSERSDGLAISLEAYDQQRKIMVQIVDNEFTVNPNRIFRKILSGDKHSLKVIGESNEEVLDVRFLNPSAISILTDFYLPNGVRVHITADEWRLGLGPLQSHICFAGNGADIGFP